MVIFQVSRRSGGVGTLNMSFCIGRGLWTRKKGVDGLFKAGESFVDAFDLLLTSFKVGSIGFSTININCTSDDEVSCTRELAKVVGEHFEFHLSSQLHLKVDGE